MLKTDPFPMPHIMQPPKVIFGAFQLERKDDAKGLLETCERMGINEIDSGAAYGAAETLLSSFSAADRFVMHGKAEPSRNRGPAILASAARSALELKVAEKEVKFDGYYLHAPDASTPIEETYEAIQELYEAGTFKRFGLSNYLPEEVERIYNYGKANGYVLPSLYQGFYNAVCRRCETDLIPTLRKLGMSFYCYSPLGAGWFMATPATVEEGQDGRWDTSDIEGLVYRAIFLRPSYMSALAKWARLAEQSGLTNAEMAWRWMSFHSGLQAECGDGIVTSADTPGQLSQLFEWRAKGALDDGVVSEIDTLWESCAGEASLDCVNGWFEAVREGRAAPPDDMQY